MARKYVVRILKSTLSEKPRLKTLAEAEAIVKGYIQLATEDEIKRAER